MHLDVMGHRHPIMNVFCPPCRDDEVSTRNALAASLKEVLARMGLQACANTTIDGLFAMDCTLRYGCMHVCMDTCVHVCMHLDDSGVWHACLVPGWTLVLMVGPALTGPVGTCSP